MAVELDAPARITEAPPPTSRLHRLVPGLVPGLVMLVFGLVGVTHVGIGWDEAATADMATRSVPQILGTVRHVDAVFAPYYLVMHFWTSAFGLSELSLRAPSIVAMAAAVGLTGELGRRLAGPVAGTLAGLFLCLLPAINRYAQEGRPYAFCCLLATLATLLLYRNLEDHRRGRWAWAGYGATVALVGAAHLVALSLLGAHAIIVARHRAPHSVRRWAVATAAALLCLAPLVMLGIGQRAAQIGWVQPPTLQDLLDAPGTITGASGSGFLLVGLALIATWRWIELTVLAVFPVAAVAAVSVLGQPVWVGRYMLFALMPLALLAAVGAAEAAGAMATIGRAGLLRLLVVLAVLAGTAYHDQRLIRGVAGHAGGNYKQAAAVVRRLDRPGDAIVYQSGRTMREGMSYYLRHDPHRPADVLVNRTAAERDRLSAGEHADPAPFLLNRTRVWLVVMGRRADPITGRPGVGPVLRADFTRVRIWRFSHTTLALYVRR